jgi:hypothetical protein
VTENNTQNPKDKFKAWYNKHYPKDTKQNFYQGDKIIVAGVGALEIGLVGIAVSIILYIDKKLKVTYFYISIIASVFITIIGLFLIGIHSIITTKVKNAINSDLYEMISIPISPDNKRRMNDLHEVIFKPTFQKNELGQTKNFFLRAP